MNNLKISKMDFCDIESPNFLDVTTETVLAFSNVNANILKCQFLVTDPNIQVIISKLNFLINDNQIYLKKIFKYLLNKNLNVRESFNGSIRFRRRPDCLIPQAIKQVKSLMTRNEFNIFCDWLRKLFSESRKEKDDIYSICFLRKLKARDEIQCIIIHIVIDKQNVEIEEINYQSVTILNNLSNFYKLVAQGIKKFKTEITPSQKINPKSYVWRHNLMCIFIVTVSIILFTIWLLYTSK
jgi:hypothetical protein